MSDISDCAQQPVELPPTRGARAWVNSLFQSGDMSVDSLIVLAVLSTIAFWLCIGYQIITGRVVIDPMGLGGGYASMMIAFGGAKTIRDRYTPGAGQQ